jgi:hypothetical protein
VTPSGGEVLGSDWERREKEKAAGEALPPSKLLTGPAPPRRSVCAPA